VATWHTTNKDAPMLPGNGAECAFAEDFSLSYNQTRDREWDGRGGGHGQGGVLTFERHLILK